MGVAKNEKKRNEKKKKKTKKTKINAGRSVMRCVGQQMIFFKSWGCFCFCFCFCFLGPHPWHLEVPRLKVESEL